MRVLESGLWETAVSKTNDAGEPTGKVTIFDAVDKQLGLNLELTKRFP